MRPLSTLLVVSLLAGAFSFSSCSKSSSKDGFGAPKNLSASDGAYIDQIKVTWESVSGAERYQIFRSDTVDGTYSEITSTSSVSYSDSEVSTAVVYYYKVKAWSSSDGYSAFSNEDSGSTGSTNNLATPVINVTAGSSAITVSWNAVSGAEKYYVYRKGPSDSDYTSYGSVTDTSFVDSTAVQGLTYKYTVRAYSSSGFSDYSAVVDGLRPSSLGTPSGVTATLADSAKITISWTAVSGADSYIISRSSSLNGTYTSIAAGITATTYDDAASVTPLNRGVYYYYTVQAVSASLGNSAESYPPVSGMVKSLVNPPVLGAVSGSSNVSLSWTAVSGAASYNVYTSEDSYTTPTNVATTSTTSTPSSPNIIVYYKLKAVASDGSMSIFSNTVSGYRGAANDAPAAPTGLGYVTSLNQITVSWSAVAGASTYNLYSSVDGRTYSLLSSQAAISYTHTGVTNGQNYWYRVSSVSSTLNEGTWSSPVIANVPISLTTPSISINTAASSGITLNVSTAEGTIRYIYRASSSASGVADYILVGNTSSATWTDTTAPSGTVSYYICRAWDAAYGYSAYTSTGVISATRLLPAAPAAPTVTTGAAAITVTSAASVTTYYFYRSETSGGSYVLVSSGASNSYIDSNVIPGQNYYYKVQTWTSAEGYSNLSPASTAGTTPTTVSAPATLMTSKGTTNGGDTTNIVITCSAVSGATRYDIYRSTSSSGVYSYVGSSADLTSAYSDNTGLSYGVKYYYKVKVYRASPQSYSDDSAASTNSYLRFPAVTGVVASKGTDISQITVHSTPTTRIALNWTTPTYGTAALRYDVYGDTTSGVPSTDTVTSAVNVDIASPTGDGNCADDTTGTSSDPIAEGSVFYYKVVVKDDTNFPGAASDKTLSATDYGYLQYTAPTISGTANNQTNVALTWTSKAGATAYNVYEDSASIYAGALTSYSYNPANSGVDHSYTVTVESSTAPMTAAYSRSAASSSITRQWVIPNFAITLSGLATVAPTGSATVNWNASAIKALSYTLEYSLNGGTSWTTLSAAAASPYTHSPLAAGNYTYRVTAVSTPNSQACSANLTNTVHFAAPSAPTAVNGVSQITLTWPVVASENRYYVYRSDYGFTTGNQIAIVTTNSYSDTSANDPAVTPTQYTYEIVAWNNGADYSGCESAFGAVSSSANRIFAAPNTGLAASTGTYTNKVQVSWGAVSGADRYNVYSSADGYLSPIATGVTSPYDDTTVANGTLYTYKIVAGIANSAYNSAPSIITNSGYKRLAAPGSVSATQGTSTSEVTVTWGTVTGATSYTLYYSSDGFGTSTSVTSVTTPYAHTAAVPGTSYTYKVVAVLGGTYDSLLSDSPVSLTGYKKLIAPTITSVTPVSTTRLDVTWGTSSGADLYELFWNTVNDSSTATTLSNQTSTYQDTTLTTGTTRWYFVKAKNSAQSGATSAFSGGVSGTTF